MKQLFLICIFISLSMPSIAQIDTLMANETHNLTLFFPSPIRQAVTGSHNFIFSYNQENAQYLGLLKARPSTSSNLLVITNDGAAYSFLLAYQKNIPVINRFVRLDESIGNEKGESDEIDLDSLTEPFSNIPSTDPPLKFRDKYFEKFSAYHLGVNHRPLASKRKDGMNLQLLDLVYDRTEVYAIFEIGNNSEIDFEVDTLDVFKVNGNKRRKSSYQKMPLTPNYMYSFPKTVKVGEHQRFVFVIPKFTLGTSEKFSAELREFNGSRILRFRYSP